MKPVVIALLLFIVLSFGLGVYALTLRIRVRGELHLIAQLTAV